MKKLICFVLCVCLIPMFCFGVWATGEISQSGDIDVEIFPNGDFNGDRTVNRDDAELYMQYTAGWSGIKYRQKLAADVTGDGVVDGMDAVLVLQRLKWGSKVVFK